MYLDSPRTIYLISPQPWDGFKVSKHHYARELSELGNQVFFIEPMATTRGWGKIEISPTEIEGIKTVRFAGYIYRWLRYRARGVYDALAQAKVRQIIDAIGTPPDVVWDFDNLFQFRDLSLFEPAIKIFHPVDSILSGWNNAKGQDIHFALSEAFANGVDSSRTPTLLIPHGLNPLHSAYAKDVLDNPEAYSSSTKTGKPVVGYVGNLAMEGIDWPTIEKLVWNNPNVSFRFIGPSENIRNPHDKAALERLHAAPNCSLPGRQTLEEILQQAREIDVWMVCYDSVRRPDAAINSHKILEYLATGKAVLSNYVTAYEGLDLIHMPDTSSNDSLPELFDQMISDLTDSNSTERMVRRASFALEHSYKANLATANRFLTNWQDTRAAE